MPNPYPFPLAHVRFVFERRVIGHDIEETEREVLYSAAAIARAIGMLASGFMPYPKPEINSADGSSGGPYENIL